MLSFFASPIIIAYFLDRVSGTIRPALVFGASAVVALGMFASLRRQVRRSPADAAAFIAVVTCVSAWLLWIARPDFLPPGHGPDLTHHLMLIDFIERHWALPHDPALEASLGEFFHYTPGSQLLVALAGAWTGVGGFHAAYPLLALSVALKAGFVFLIAVRAMPGGAPRVPLAIAAVLLIFAPRAYVLGSFTHDFFFAQVMGELFAVAVWWALTVWDQTVDARLRGAALAIAALGGTAVFLTWPIWIGPLLLTLGALVVTRESLSRTDRFTAFALGTAPIVCVAVVYSAERLRWISIVRTSGGVTWPAPSATGWIFPVLALAGFAAALTERRTRSTVLLIAAIVAQAAALFAVARRRPADTPYMALKMAYLAVYPLAVCGAVGLARLLRGRAAPRLAWTIVAILGIAIGRQTVLAPRDAPVVSEAVYRAGEWARANVPAGCAEYLVADPDTAYWLHLAVLGNPRSSARTADAETFDERRALVRWITTGGLPYAVAELSTLPRAVRDEAIVVAQFDGAAVLKRPSAEPCR